MNDRAHHIYRHFDADDRLLYVGVTVNPGRRPYERRDRDWMGESVRVEVSGPMSRDDALEAERTAIRDEAPLHNVYRNNGNKTAQYRYWEEQERIRRARFDFGELVSLDPEDFYGLAAEEALRVSEAVSAALAPALAGMTLRAAS